MRYARKDGRPSAYEFGCGAIERIGEFVTISMEHGAYLVRRSPHHPRGWACVGASSAREARSIARKMLRASGPLFPAPEAS